MPVRPEGSLLSEPDSDGLKAARSLFGRLGREWDLGAPVTAVLCRAQRPVFAAGDGCVYIINPLDEGIIQVRAHAGAILTAASGPKGDEILTGGDDGLVRMVGRGSDNPRTIARAKRDWIDHVAYAPWGGIAWAAGREVEIIADNAVHKVEIPSTCGGLAFAPKGQRLAIAHYGGVTVSSPSLGGWATERLDWGGSHIGVTWSPDCRFLLSPMQESALHGWRLADKVSLHMSNFPAKPKSLSWSRNGKWLATSGGQGLLLWPFKGKDGPMGRSAKQLAVRESLISSVAFQPKSNVVAIGYADGAILLLRQADEHMVIVRPPDGCAIGTLFWASSGNWLAFAACDRLAGVIDIAWGADGRL